MEGLAICTALAPIIGYDEAARLAHIASESGETIKQVAQRETKLTGEKLDKVLEPLSMTEPKV
jgi:fumarate hydratase class II